MEYLAYALITIGLFFVITGTLGVFRFKDIFSRLHPAGVTDSLGAPLVLLGLVFLEGFTLTSLKLLILIIILLLTAPLVCHAVAKAAHAHKNDSK